MTHVRSFIGGRHETSPETYENIDPATGATLGTVARGTAATIALAVDAARSAQRAWARTAPVQRADALERFARTVLDNIEELALLESQDTGKPLNQAINDVRVCARYFQFYSRAIDSYYGVQIPLDPSYHVVSTREPYGVIGHILAWNYPMQLFARAVAPAIATGNAVVVKPADETPRTAVRLAELAQSAGIPDGVINVVTGIGAEAGAALADNPGIDHIGFVGSTAVGTLIAQSAARRVVPAVLELGGKSPHVVFDDSDLDEVSTTVVKTIIQNAGQTCSAGSRLLVQSSIKDELLERVATKLAVVTMGPGTDDPDMGPLISMKQQSRVTGYVGGAAGQTLVGGGVPSGFSAGAYFEPTLIADVDPYSPIAQEEIFGPVLVAMEFGTETEAIHLANATEYGLIAAVWTHDLDRAHRVSREIQAGQVFVNNYGAGGGVELPFGGFKKSGYGREKGVEALDSCTQSKTTIFKIAELRP